MHSRFSVLIPIILFTISACTYPTIPEPPDDATTTIPAPVIQTVTPSFYTATSTETFAPAVATLTEGPSATPTDTSTPMPLNTPTTTLTVVNAPTLMPWKIPVNTPLPPLPDFDQALTIGGAAGPNLYIMCKYNLLPGKTPPAIAGGIIYYNETAFLCLLGAPLDTPFQVELTSPDGELKLKGVFQANSKPNNLLWAGHISEDYGNMVFTHEAPFLVIIRLWWPVDLPAGIWQIHVKWADGETYGSLEVGITEDVLPGPRIQVRDSRMATEMLPVRPSSIVIFHPSDTQEMLGAGFEPNSVVYVLLYTRTDGVYSSLRLSFVTGTPILTDDQGEFAVGFPANLEKGRNYMALAVVDPEAKLTIDLEELGLPIYDNMMYSNMNSNAIEAKDFFYIEPVKQ